MLNLREDISAKDIIDAIIRANVSPGIVSQIRQQFKYNWKDAPLWNGVME